MAAENLHSIRSRRLCCAASVILLLALTNPVAAKDSPPAKPANRKRGGFVVTPVVYFTPETSLAGGIVGIHYFQLGRSIPPARLSHYRFNFIYTQKEQAIAQIDYELYLAGGTILLDGMAKYALFPDRFYGSGNRSLTESREDFNSRNWRLQMNLQRRWGGSLFAGLRLEIFSIRMLETEDGGLLAAGDISGSRGAKLSGLGLFSKWDSRDNTFSASKGTYCALFLNFFTKALGSDFAFSQITLDARKYFPLGRASVLAVQGVFKSAWGECPFQILPLFGGLNLLRGYYEGRYRDRNMFALQAEYRQPLWGRFGLCGFAGLAQVQPKPGLFSVSEFHPAAGVGLRYKFNRRENLNVRLDAGFAGPAPAFYLTFAEAF